MTTLRSGLLIAMWLLLLLPTCGQQKSTPLTAQEITALKTAILDEIYDYEFEGKYVDISLLTPSGYELNLYIDPKLDNGGGEVIYKLPIGEVARIFQVNGDLATLVREPRDKFPPTSSSTLTLYLPDKDLCDAKRNWIHEKLFIDPHPSKKDVQAAILRERKRKGTSQHDETEK